MAKTYGDGNHPLSYFEGKSDEEILKLKGIGPALLQEIRAELGTAQGTPATGANKGKAAPLKIGSTVELVKEDGSKSDVVVTAQNDDGTADVRLADNTIMQKVLVGKPATKDTAHVLP